MPCRREAPYLTKLNEKYSSQGFAVIAVNAYDEEKPVVSQFVSKEKLKQIVLLKGSGGARTQDAGRNFPTTVWIDAEGKIVRREMGFDPSLFRGMELMARKLVAERENAAKG